jgi:hypothetical protein
MNAESTLKQLKEFADGISKLAADFSKQLEVLDIIQNDVSSKLIDAKDTLKQDLYVLQDSLSTIEDKVKEFFDKQDVQDGDSG